MFCCWGRPQTLSPDGAFSSPAGNPNSPPIHAHHNGSLDSPSPAANGNALNGGGNGGGAGSGSGGANNSSNNSGMATTAGIETEPVMYYEPRCLSSCPPILL